MQSILKLLRRFVGILMLSILLLIILNVTFYGIAFVQNIPTVSAWDVAEQAGAALHTVNNKYALSNDMSAKLKEQHIWAILIDENTRQVVWQTDNLPDNIPTHYTLSDIASLTSGYINGYPTFTGKSENGLLVLGYPKDSYWKLTRANWDYKFIADFPKNVVIFISINIVLIFLIYAVANSKLIHSIKPIINGIQNLSNGTPVHINEKGILSELAANINQTSSILQKQAEQLQKKETARANWIAGISHDIRTPLSIVMGYAVQLEQSPKLLETERERAGVIVKQSKRIKNLINDLNLASKLEYNMQPLMKKQENAVAIVRQVTADFINMDIDDKFPIEWKTAENISACFINADKALLKRAIANLIQNSMNHNESGCNIYVSVIENNNSCIICVEDSGAGASDSQIEKLNNTPHYMICETNTTKQRHGLGLLIVKQIMDAHKGKTIIEHSEYGGLKVMLIIPN